MKVLFLFFKRIKNWKLKMKKQNEKTKYIWIFKIIKDRKIKMKELCEISQCYFYFFKE